MRHTLKLVCCVVLVTLMTASGFQLVLANPAADHHYQQGSSIHAEVTIQDKSGAEHRLLDLIELQNKSLSVIYIFGGGAMGAERITRGIWCQDSYEDLHILRTLFDNYSDRVGFIAIAEPPVFNTKMFGFKDRALLDDAQDSETYESATQAFIASNQVAVERGLIPFEPYLDIFIVC